MDRVLDFCWERSKPDVRGGRAHRPTLKTFRRHRRYGGIRRGRGLDSFLGSAAVAVAQEIGEEKDQTPRLWLPEAAPLHRGDEDLRKAYLDAAESISSEGEYRRVMRVFNNS